MKLADLLKPSSGIDNPVLSDALDLTRASKLELYGAKCSAILEDAETRLTNFVDSLRAVRRQETDLKKKIKEAENQIAYLKKTGNPFPALKSMGYWKVNDFCHSVGVETPSDAETKIPKNWKVA